MAFYAVSTMQGREIAVADDLSNTSSQHIHAVLAPDTLKSYVIVEADGLSPVEKEVADVYGANKVLPGMTSLQEVKSYLNPPSRVKDIHEGELVEITDGPYMGQNARVKHVNNEKEQVTVELHEETIPLSVAVNGDQLRAKES
jgi:transcriptional antiterminator NusG